MKFIFLTMSRITNISSRGVYIDLMRKFRDEGHDVYIVTPFERSLGKATEFAEKDGVHMLGVKTLNLQKTSIIEKGLGQVFVEDQFKWAIKEYLKGINFDLILYSTPPITFSKVISYLKRHNPKAKTYLLLKDIFPQNAVDIGLLQSKPVQGSLFKIQSWVGMLKYQLYKRFRKKEKALYQLSDFIGCMSPANVEYVLMHNPEVSADRVEVAPNSVDLSENVNLDLNEGALLSKSKKNLNEDLLVPTSAVNSKHHILNFTQVREKYGLPVDKPIFIYGGNLGKPQGILYLIECLNANAYREDCYFVVIGTGTELSKLKAWYDKIDDNLNLNVKVMDGLPKKEYDELVSVCDVGLIFLDHRFTIPNYPSRLLSYLENKMPVLCATDPNTDMGRIAEENGYGYWCESNSVEAFTVTVDKMIVSDLTAMGEKGYKFLCENYLVQNTYDTIMSHL